MYVTVCVLYIYIHVNIHEERERDRERERYIRVTRSRGVMLTGSEAFDSLVHAYLV